MYKVRKRLLALVLAVVMIIGGMPITAQATQAHDNGADFNQKLEQLRQELFSPIRPAMDMGLTQVFLEDDYAEHQPPERFIPGEGTYFGVEPFGQQVYVEGSTRNFRAMLSPGSSTASTIQGNLVRQGNHVNIWVIDPDAYAVFANLDSNPGRAHQNMLAEIATDTVLLDKMIARFDDIYERMTRDFGAFAGVRIATTYPNLPLVGDVSDDGRINVLLYNIQGKSTLPGATGSGGYVAGSFTPMDFTTSNNNTPIALFHMDIARYYGYQNVASNAASRQLAFYSTFAHEFQHMLFFMYFEVYTTGQVHADEFLWFNESLSELAGAFWAQDGVEVIPPLMRILSTLENSYARAFAGAADFLNFNNSIKSYGMSRFHGSLMHKLTAGAYVSYVYDFFRVAFPPATNTAQFVANRANLNAYSMRNTIGNAFNAAGLTGSTNATGSTAFDLLYFIFMENFAADGGNIVSGDNVHTTMQFIPSNSLAAFNFWGIRPNLGTSNWVFQTQSSIVLLTNRTPLPLLHSGGSILLSGYSGTPPLGASHEMLYRLVGESAENQVLTISINDNSPYTRYYVVVPNDLPPRAVSSSMTPFPNLGSNGATVHPLAVNNAINVIDTGGQTAYLFVATLFRNVNATLEYSWGAEIGPTPSPTPESTPTPTPGSTPTPTPGQAVGVSSWEELRAAINAAPDGVDTTIRIYDSFSAPSGGVGNAIIIPADKQITLISFSTTPGAANARTLIQSNPGQRHFIVGADSRLKLGQNIILDGGDIAGGIQVNGGGELVMNDGSLITNTRALNPVALSGSGTEPSSRAGFTMLGGAISNNVGNNVGGVHVGANSIFVMRGNSEISYNTAIATQPAVGGVWLAQATSVLEMHDMAAIRDNALTSIGNGTFAGGVLVSAGNFTMHDGSIANNRAASAVVSSNGGVHVLSGTFIMHDGSITGHNRSAVSLGTSSGILFVMNGGTISNNDGTGVNMRGGVMEMNGGMISNHVFSANATTISGPRRGGVYLQNGTFTMSGGTISDNEHPWGAGVLVIGGIFNMTSDDARIENNHATIGGGGVHISTRGQINISAGVITGNSAPRGGGAHIQSAATGAFSMTGGSITDNTATINGGGVYSTRANHSLVLPAVAFSNLNIGSDVVFSGNSAGGGLSAPPSNLLPHIATTSASIWGNPLNNYDINFTGRLGQEPGISSWEALRAAVNASPVNIPTTLYVISSFEAPTGAVGNEIIIPANRHITLVSSNTTSGATNVRTLTQSNLGQRHFIVDTDSSLMLSQNITLDGGNIAGGIQINSSGELVMNEGSTITNTRALTPVVLHGSGTTASTRASFTMLGGAIKNNVGNNVGGVHVGANSIFVMRGNSEISYNTATATQPVVGGVWLAQATSVLEMHDMATIRDNALTSTGNGTFAGGVLVSAGNFTMYGGSIANNRAASAAVSSNGGVQVLSGTFIMHDGSITGHNRSAVSLGTSSGILFVMNGGTISDNDGTGVNMRGGVMEMNGGTISNHVFSANATTISGPRRGGVYLQNGTFTMSGGTISDNEHPWGAGVLVIGGVFNMTSDDARIENNHATIGGGGVHISTRGQINISAGVITGNSAPRGGGAHIQSAATGAFTMTGGSITNNTATFNGGGIYSTRANHSVTLPSAAFNNLSIGSNVIFSGNAAGNGLSAPPNNTLPHIATTSASIWGNPLNNYDINFTGRLGQEPGISTWEALRAAVNAAPANTPTIIYVLTSFEAPTGIEGNAITIPANRQIILVSSNTTPSAANVRIITQHNPSQHHFVVYGSLTLGRNITLSIGTNAGGVLVEDDGTLIMGGGSEITG